MKKNTRAIIIDYDTTSRNLHVADKSILIWLVRQSRDQIVDELGITKPVEFQKIG